MQLIYNLLIAIDQLVNTLLLGHPDETISSRLGRSMGKERYIWVKGFRIFVDTLFFFDTKGKKRHCQKSVMRLEQKNFRKFSDYEIWSWSIEDKGE